MMILKKFDYGIVDKLYVYDPKNNGFSYRNAFPLSGKFLHKVQGGCFSSNGHIDITADDGKGIHCYSALNGNHLGEIVVDKGDWDGYEEIEGITVQSLNRVPEGDLVSVHVIVLDNDADFWKNKDDVYFKHFKVPFPEFL